MLYFLALDHFEDKMDFYSNLVPNCFHVPPQNRTQILQTDLQETPIFWNNLASFFMEIFTPTSTYLGAQEEPESTHEAPKKNLQKEPPKKKLTTPKLERVSAPPSPLLRRNPAEAETPAHAPPSLRS